MSLGFTPFFVVFVAAVLLFLLIATSEHRRYLSLTRQKLCRGCGENHPNFAVFCRRCGRKL